MNGNFMNSTTGQIYGALWNKYRPAVLQLMIASESGPQEYKLYEHELKTLNPKEKGGYSFTLQVYQGKAINKIKNQNIAKDLLSMLCQSPKAMELTSRDQYEFSLSKKFVLSVSKQEVVTSDVEEAVEV